MRVVERWLGADALEFSCPDLDDGNAQIVVEVGNDVIGHDSVRGLGNTGAP
jgi:hypothetical protein